MLKKKQNLPVRLLIILFAVLILAAGVVGFLFWKAVYKNNISLADEETGYLFIKTGSDYADLLTELSATNYLKNTKTFTWLAERKNLPNHIYPGRYEIKAGMNNDELIDMLRSGAQKPLNVIFNNIRTIEQLAGVISRQIEADSVSLTREFANLKNYTRFKLNSETLGVIYIPNTYQFYWNTSAKSFLQRMAGEY
jgi:UPF0755 protein